MKTCDFEKDANAMVLFDKADVYFDKDFNIIMEEHRRLKIFNDNGKDAANVRIEYVNANHSEYITGLQAETINLTDGKVDMVKLDKKLLYTEAIDKYRSAYVFTFPNIKSGSVIEYKFTKIITDIYDFPDWFFQDKIPVRYSELDTEIPDMLTYTAQSHIKDPFVLFKNSTDSRSIGSGSDIFSYSVAIEKKSFGKFAFIKRRAFYEFKRR